MKRNIFFLLTRHKVLALIVLVPDELNIKEVGGNVRGCHLAGDWARATLLGAINSIIDSNNFFYIYIKTR